MLFKSRLAAALTAFACLAKQISGQNATNSPCYVSLTDIDDDERLVNDLEVVRTYILCANTTFFTGFLTNNDEILGGDRPLTLRKNMQILCGKTGSSVNNCVISRGSFALTSLPSNFDPPTVNTGVVVKGVTFDNAFVVGILIQLPGEFQFIDCIFTNMRAEVAAIVLEWDGGTPGGGNSSRMLLAPNATGRYSYTPVTGHGRSKQDKQREEEAEERDLQTATTLKVEFIDCLFANNSCVSNSNLGLVILGGDGIDTTFSRCEFDNDDFAVPGVNDAEAYGVIIEKIDFSALTIENSCFTNNKAYGNALVVSYGDDIGTLTNNYGLGNTVESTDPLQCTFASLASLTSFANLECVEFDAATCQRDAAPTPATPAPGPTVTPAPMETGMPSAPVTAETIMPTVVTVLSPTPAVMPAPSSQTTAPMLAVETLTPTSDASPKMRVAPLIAALTLIAIVA